MSFLWECQLQRKDLKKEMRRWGWADAAVEEAGRYFHFPFYSISFPFFHLLIILSQPPCFWQYMLLHDPVCTMSVSSPLSNKELKVWKETNGGEESMRWRWEEMVRISIIGWDSISIIDIDLRFLLYCLSQGALPSVCLFTRCLKLEINPSCSFEGSHKQRSVTS